MCIASFFFPCFCWGCTTWVTVDVNFRGAGRRPGEHALVQRFGSCGVLGLFDAGAFCLPHLLPESQLHCEDLEQRSPEGEASTDGGRFYIFNNNNNSLDAVRKMQNVCIRISRETRHGENIPIFRSEAEWSNKKRDFIPALLRNSLPARKCHI